MSFGGHAYEAMKRTQDNRKLGKVRKIRFKDKEHYHKYRNYVTVGKITQTEEEKQKARQKVQEEIKQQRKTHKY